MTIPVVVSRPRTPTKGGTFSTVRYHISFKYLIDDIDDDYSSWSHIHCIIVNAFFANITKIR